MARETPTYRAELERLDAAFPDREFLTAKELAGYLGISTRSITRNWQEHFNKTIHGFTKVRIASVLAS